KANAALVRARWTARRPAPAVNAGRRSQISPPLCLVGIDFHVVPFFLMGSRPPAGFPPRAELGETISFVGPGWNGFPTTPARRFETISPPLIPLIRIARNLTLESS